MLPGCFIIHRHGHQLAIFKSISIASETPPGKNIKTSRQTSITRHEKCNYTDHCHFRIVRCNCICSIHYLPPDILENSLTKPTFLVNTCGPPAGLTTVDTYSLLRKNDHGQSSQGHRKPPNRDGLVWQFDTIILCLSASVAKGQSTKN